jgi:hypothetical protein
MKERKILMKINTRGNILEIEDARIIFRNFAGLGSKYNREGDRNFAVIIPNEEIKDFLVENGWTVKIKPPREDEDSPFMYLPVKVKFNNRGPAAYVQSGDQHTKLNEDTIDMLDEIDIASVDMDIRPYDWEVNGKTGRSAYLQAINVIQNIDRFGARFAAEKENK